MNPPYMRHHGLDYKCDIHALISIVGKVKISKLSNSYLLFVIKACELLKSGGRAAVIIPTEWANANFGQSLKDYLLENNYLRHIIYFSNAAEIFSDALTTACILFIEKENKPTPQIATSYLHSSENLNINKILNDKSLTKFIDSSKLRHSSKWDYLIKCGPVVELSGFVPLSELAFTKRGIATGANNYFHLTLTETQKFKIDSSHTLPCVGKAQDVKKFLFSKTDYSQLIKDNKRTHLIVFDSKISDSEMEYIKNGEELDLPNRFLLSRRKPWYFMENRSPAPIWAAVFGRKNLKFIYNEAMVSNLTTFHGIYPSDSRPKFIRALVVALNSKVVQEQARSNVRVYGGGLLKFEPNDILDIKVPNLTYATEETIQHLDYFFSKIGDFNYEDKIDELVIKAANESTFHSRRLI
jgi:adenine-specific DNA-methyltransferase